MNTFIEIFDSHFRTIHGRSCEFVALLPSERLFWKPSIESYSCGEYLLRSAAAVEQTFGGITVRLWDDPFEWTLPEELSTRDRIVEYLDEVEATRNKGFAYFTSDADLRRQIPAPEELTSIFELLLDTVSRANHFQGRAFAIFQAFSNDKLPRV
ncbi:MAG: hypothetical protein ABIU09_06425 [Pyrinomonadaceae bacterium]